MEMMDGSFSLDTPRAEDLDFLSKRVAYLNSTLDGSPMTREEQVNVAWVAKGVAERARAWGVADVKTPTARLARLIGCFQ